jgi:ABC-type nitrate/sulfonate/bicarbonate transport system substrate-binding protein
MQSDRTRTIFFVIIFIAFVVVGAGVIINAVNQPEPTPTLSGPAPTDTPGPATATPAPSFDAVFAPDREIDEELPTYTCAADSFGSYFTLQLIQMQGYDVENGFNLAIIPFGLTDEYSVTEERRAELLRSGQWDCMLLALSTVALNNPGVITTVIDESAGADQIWARDIKTFEELRDKRIAFSRGSVGEYMMLYVLSVAQLNPRTDVELVPADSVGEAVEIFNQGRADVVSGWEPTIYGAEEGGGEPLVSSNQLRVVIDVIATSPVTIQEDPDLVQSFHNAWFAALKYEFENFSGAADAIAAWGNNDWTYVYADSAETDLEAWLATVAQAGLDDNVAVMRDSSQLVKRIESARRVWSISGLTPPDYDANDLIDTRFVLNIAEQLDLSTTADPINDTFSMTSRPDLSTINAEDAQTLAVLPCRRFNFLPDSAELTLESRRLLDNCVVPIMSESIGLYLQVTGSSAWPGPAGTYSEQEIYDFALARAEAVRDYLASQGIDPARFVVDAVIPPEERRETEDAELQALDRYVEMTLITTGR